MYSAKDISDRLILRNKAVIEIFLEYIKLK